MTLILGSKGGGSSTPVEADDTLSSTAYAQILDLLGEGPIAGFPDNLSPAQCVYFNDTPLQNPDGSYNFQVKQLDYRLGYVDQPYIAGFESSAAETQVGVSLTAAQSWAHTFTNIDISAVRITLSVSGLSKTDPNSGNISGYRVAYQIQVAKDNGSFTTVLDTAFDGKASSTYTRSHRIDLSGAKSQYTVRVVRTTPDSTTQYIQDKTSVVSYAEIIDAKLTYPYSALVAIQIDAEQFSSMPTRGYDVRGLLVKYPSNYNPQTRTYTGTWDGTFSFGWTDNPAWIFYDLVLNKRYGLGRYVDATMIDRYALYQIGRYCDVLVSDGKGGQEPRFTCNCYIATRADAIKVIQDLASVFRGIAYWSAGSVIAAADMPSDPVYVYTPANVIGGQFKYVGSSLRTRYTTALVTYNDPANRYRQTVEYVEDADGINRYGVNKAELTAFGCTSRSQAQRVGQWALLTSRYETNAVTFSVGMDGTLAQPGQVIAVADPLRSGKRMGGRIRQVASSDTVTLDREPESISKGDRLTVVLPNGTAQSRIIQSASGPIVTVSAPLDLLPVAGAVWMLESATLKAQLFRVTSVSEKEGITFEISATQHEPGKFAAVDSGAAIDPAPITERPLTSQASPTNVRLTQFVVIDQGIARTNMTIAWDAAPNAVAYVAEFRKDNGEWITAGRTGGVSIDVPNIYTGRYVARVRAVNALDIVSPYAFSTETVLQGKTGSPPKPLAFTASTDQVMSIRLTWAFSADAADTAYTEVYYSDTPSFEKASQLSRYGYPTSSANLLNLAAGHELYFWARLVDTSGNIGPWFPDVTAPGVRGAATADTDLILGYLVGKITSTELSKDLLAPIQEIPDLKQKVEDNDARITSEQQARLDGDKALAGRIDKVEAQVLVPEMAGSDGDYAGSTQVYAGVWSEQSARAEADLALSQRIDTTTAQFTSANSSLIAAVRDESQARADAISAQAQRITTVEAKANDNAAAVQTVAKSYADLNGQLSASYTVKTSITRDGRTYMAGISLGVNGSGGDVESQVLVAASRFAVLDPNGSVVTSPFVIQGGQVFLNEAFIGNGFIKNAMIGSYIQSDNYIAGRQGWRLDKSGWFEINNTDGQGNRLNIDSNGVRGFDANGTLRYRLGFY
ncbi:host specificity protein J [Burkholderia multivorans]|uniref:host specificity protein J n=1 Tax=Burkholderia multivorans TaxID=87883 RepID=UPI00143EE1F4|nr:host specificity protein J [Burkholderia multivorans]QIX17312.1 host specificity protein J [Burkholderia multivorans]